MGQRSVLQQNVIMLVFKTKSGKFFTEYLFSLQMDFHKTNTCRIVLFLFFSSCNKIFFPAGGHIMLYIKVSSGYRAFVL